MEHNKETYTNITLYLNQTYNGKLYDKFIYNTKQEKVIVVIYLCL